MKPTFKVSSDTAKLVAFFVGMGTKEVSTYEAAAKAIGFIPNPSCIASARKIAERDHGVFIATIRNVGFMRGAGDDMKDSGFDFLRRIRKSAKKGASRMELAIRNNLDERAHQEASEMFSRMSIIASTAQKTQVKTNRAVPEPAPIASPSTPFDNLRRMRK